MFGYRHAFHAGNFADVFKHAVLVELLDSLSQKDKPFWVLDTHAGVGHYDLLSDASTKTAEYKAGIQQIWQKPLPELTRYIAAINQAYQHMVAQRTYQQLPVITHPHHYYPGSPQLILNALRADDRLVACELNAADCSILKSYFRNQPKIAIHLKDGFEAIRAFCPPQIKRGLVFIDPPYEDKKDFQRLYTAAQYLHKHWRNAMLAIWYPILSGNYHLDLLADWQTGITQQQLGESLNLIFQITSNETQGMSGCGMLIMNPPWQLDQWAIKMSDALLGLMRQSSAAHYQVKWLKP